MSGKRNSRTAECPVDSQGISAAREFRRNIECLKAEMTERRARKELNNTNEKKIRIVINKKSLQEES